MLALALYTSNKPFLFFTLHTKKNTFSTFGVFLFKKETNTFFFTLGFWRFCLFFAELFCLLKKKTKRKKKKKKAGIMRCEICNKRPCVCSDSEEEHSKVRISVRTAQSEEDNDDRNDNNSDNNDESNNSDCCTPRSDKCCRDDDSSDSCSDDEPWPEPCGPQGFQGPPGPPFVQNEKSTVSNTSRFYNLNDGDKKPIAAGNAVPFPLTRVESPNVTRLNASQFRLNAKGTFNVSFRVTMAQGGQLQLELASDAKSPTPTFVPIVSSTCTNLSPISGGLTYNGSDVVVTTTSKSILRLVNPRANTSSTLELASTAGSVYSAPHVHWIDITYVE